MSKYRLQKLGNQLRGEIAALIMRQDVKDPRVNGFLSISRVEITKDLSSAKVYVSSFLDDASVERGVQGLQNAAGFIQGAIAKKLSIYRFPRLTFVADRSVKEGFKMVQVLNALEKAENAESRAQDGTREMNGGSETDKGDERNSAR